MHHPPYLTIEKSVGETPLVALERLRSVHHIPSTVPLAYAGRLDPMASGKLLVLVGDECKKQEQYHAFDKEYQFEILLGIKSDTGDVLGILSAATKAPTYAEQTLTDTIKTFCGNISLPYPHFSSRTVKGKPLHTWTLEGRLDEIEIPVQHSHVYRLALTGIRTVPAQALYTYATEKIETIPQVTDERKALGADFRRTDVRASWQAWYKIHENETYQIASCTCIASSGTYMRSLAEAIGSKLDTPALALSIHRTKIGKYLPIIPHHVGIWTKSF